MADDYKNKTGCGVMLIYLFSWGLYGLFIAISLVATLSIEWEKVSGVNMGDVPAGIMASGSFGGIIALLICLISGPIICSIRAKKWNQKTVILSGIFGPAMGITGGIFGLLVKSPMLLFILLVAGMPIGVSLGINLGKRKLGN